MIGLELNVSSEHVSVFVKIKVFNANPLISTTFQPHTQTIDFIPKVEPSAAASIQVRVNTSVLHIYYKGHQATRNNHHPLNAN